jgi:hypothetical protein
LKKPAITPNDAASGAISRYDDLVATHINQTMSIHFVVGSPFLCSTPEDINRAQGSLSPLASSLHLILREDTARRVRIPWGATILGLDVGHASFEVCSIAHLRCDLRIWRQRSSCPGQQFERRGAGAHWRRLRAGWALCEHDSSSGSFRIPCAERSMFEARSGTRICCCVSGEKQVGQGDGTGGLWMVCTYAGGWDSVGRQSDPRWRAVSIMSCNSSQRC